MSGGTSGPSAGSGGEQPFLEARHADDGEPGAGRRFRCRAGPQRRAVRPLLVPLIPPAKPGGRPRTTDMRRMLDGLFYLVRTGCQWRHLPPPPAFPPWRTIYGYMRAFADAGVWEGIRHHLVVMLRERDGREPSPSAAIVDTQSVKTTERIPCGWMAARLGRSGPPQDSMEATDADRSPRDHAAGRRPGG